MSLPDVNVLVYAINRKALFQRPCEKWLVDALNGSEPLSFTWHALLGFVRVSTNPRAIVAPLPVKAALNCVEQWLAQASSRILEPLDTHPSTLRRMLETSGIGGNLVSDA